MKERIREGFSSKRIQHLRTLLKCNFLVFGLFLSSFIGLSSNLFGQDSSKNISILWQKGPQEGVIKIRNGHLKEMEIVGGRGEIDQNEFKIISEDGVILNLQIEEAHLNPGPNPTLVSIETKDNPFSFFLRDVNSQSPIFIKNYEVVVLPEKDKRSYAQVRDQILSAGLKTKLGTYETETGESFESAAIRTLDMKVPTWLGLGRDYRIFQISEWAGGGALPNNMDVITTKLAGIDQKIRYVYKLGKGVGVSNNLHRQLERGYLPILHSTYWDDDVKYVSTRFVSLEKSNPNIDLKGTPSLIADQYGIGVMQTKEQIERREKLKKTQLDKSEETVLYWRTEITNESDVPQYAWMMTPRPWFLMPGVMVDKKSEFDPTTGFSYYNEDSVFLVTRFNGKPMEFEEMAALIQPHETAVLEFYMPHSPIPKERAKDLYNQSFDKKKKEIISYWNEKLTKSAKIQVPEKRIAEMLKANLLQMDLITYGQEPDGPLTPTIGIYASIGSESAPIMQYYMSVGWEKEARRSLEHFLYKQREDGFIQNFGGYMVETGYVLWSIADYYFYTRDKEWIEENEEKILKAVHYLERWRERNKVDSLINKGYGMIEGKVADPEYPFHAYMLNGYSYLGLKKTAEMMEELNPSEALKINTLAKAWKQDIRKSFFYSLAHSPVVPIGDGSWVPSVPPWTEDVAPFSLYMKNQHQFTHGNFVAMDDLLGPGHLIFTGVIDKKEEAAQMMLDYQTQLYYQQNVGISQPYYSRLDWAELMMGFPRSFLKTYYNAVSAIADRETYTFWEHLFGASPHKTHETAWFLMQTRWMLWLEDGKTLNLLKGIPQKWLEDGKEIKLEGVRSYFGPIDLKVVSNVKEGEITADISCLSDDLPEKIVIRLPHPEGKKAKKVSEGEYNAATESVTLSNFGGQARIKLSF